MDPHEDLGELVPQTIKHLAIRCNIITVLSVRDKLVQTSVHHDKIQN